MIELSLARKKLKKYTKIIYATVFIGLIFTLVAESVALNWRIWYYSQDKTFGIYLGAALETFIYAIFVTIAVSSATLIWSDVEEDNKSLIKTTIYEVKDKLKEWSRTVK